MSSQVLNGFRVLALVAEFGNAEVTSPIVFRRLDADEPFGILCRHTSEKQCINNAEDGYICRNPKGRGQNCDRGKPWVLAQHARAVPQVLPQRFHKRFPSGGVDNFLRDLYVPSFQTRRSKRILAAHPLPNLFFGGHLQEAA